MIDIYIGIYVVVVSIITIYSSNSKNKRIQLTGILIIYLLCALLFFYRDPLAPADTLSYQSMYSSANSFNYVFEEYHGDVIFSLTLVIGNILSISYENFFTLYSITILSLIFYTFVKINNKNKNLIISIGLVALSAPLFFLLTNVVRQGLALLFLLLMLQSIKNQGKLLSLIFAGMALFSHMPSMALIIPTYFAYAKFKKIKKYTNKIVAMSVIAFSIILLYYLSSYIELNILQKTTTYSSGESYENIIFYIRSIFVFFIAFLFYRKNFLSKTVEYDFLISLILIFLILSPISLLASSRILYYIEIIIIIMVSNFLDLSKNLRWFIRSPFSIFLLMAYGIIILNNNSLRIQLGY